MTRRGILTSIIWSMTNEDDEDFEHPSIVNFETLLQGEWASCESNAEAAVGEICTGYFDPSVWGESFGDDLSGDCLVEVHSPASIAGLYRVDLQRVVKANARQVAGPKKLAWP